MSSVVDDLFRQELSRRGVAFRHDAGSDRYIVQWQESELYVSLTNIEREYERDRDTSRVYRFIDSLLSPLSAVPEWEVAEPNIYACLEPRHEDRGQLAVAISERVDKTLVFINNQRGTITFIEPFMLDRWRATLPAVQAAASANLARALNAAALKYHEIDGVRLGYFETAHYLKSGLLLAPNLEAVAGPILGWPLLAVVPSRDFLYLWDARHWDFGGRVGRLVVDEFTKSPYPITTEVLSVSASGLEAVGAFPT